MPYKPKSLDDINSLYDSDIAAARAIEQGKSKLKEEASAPEVHVPTISDEAIEGKESINDISTVVDDFIRAMNSGELTSKPSRIKIDTDSSGVPPKKPTYRPGIHAPRTGVQGLSSQQSQSGPVVTNSSARPTSGERPFRSGQPIYDVGEGGPNYAKQKAAAEEARRQASELEKQRKQDEYRKILATEGSGRRTSEEMDEFLSEYASVMNDEDDVKAGRRQRRRAQRSEPVPPAPQPPVERGDAFESFFYDVTEDIPEEQRHMGSNVVQSSNFDEMFDGTDMATLPYSAKQFIYEQKLMYEEQARLARDEYDRKIAEDYARSQAEQELLRAEQERIRREADERRRLEEESFVEKEYEFRRQNELLEQKLQEEARLKEEEARRRDEEIQKLTAERDRLLAEQEALSIQMREESLALEENERLRAEELAAFNAEKESLLARQAELSNRLVAQQEMIDSRIEEQSSEEVVEEADYPVESESFEEDHEAFEEEAEEEILDRRAEKKRLKEERALDRAAEKEMVREAKERAKAERLAAREAKKGGMIPDEAIEEDEAGFVVEESEVFEEEAFGESFEEEVETAEKPKRGAARAFFRFVLAICLIVSIAALGAVVSLESVFKLHTGEKAVFGNYIFFTASQSVPDTDIKAGDLVILRGADSANNGEVVAYVDEGYYGFGTKSDVSIDSDGETFYNFSQGDGVPRSKIVGVVIKTVPTIGTYLDIATKYHNIFIAVLAALAIVLFILVVFMLRNKNKVRGSKKREKKALNAAENPEAESVEEPVEFEPEYDEVIEPAEEYEAQDEFIPQDYDEYPEDGEVASDDVQPEEEQFEDAGADAFDEPAPEEAEPAFEVYEPLEGEEAESAEPVGDPAFDELTNWLNQLEEAESGEVFKSDATVGSEEPSFEEVPEEADAEPLSVHSDGQDEFEDVVSSNEEIVFDDEDEEAPYQPGDGTFFGDSGELFGDFDKFDDDVKGKKEKKPSRKQKKKDKKRRMDRYTADADDQGDVFDSL